MHVRTTKTELDNLFKHKVGASLYVAQPIKTKKVDDVEVPDLEGPHKVVILMIGNQAGWIPIYTTFELLENELQEMDPDAVRVSEIAG